MLRGPPPFSSCTALHPSFLVSSCRSFSSSPSSLSLPLHLSSFSTPFRKQTNPSRGGETKILATKPYRVGGAHPRTHARTHTCSDALYVCCQIASMPTNASEVNLYPSLLSSHGRHSTLGLIRRWFCDETAVDGPLLFSLSLPNLPQPRCIAKPGRPKIIAPPPTCPNLLSLAPLLIFLVAFLI